MYVFGSEGVGLMPPAPRGGMPGTYPDAPVNIRLPATRTDPFNGEANAVLNAFKTEWQKILAAHITAVGERARRMKKLLAFVVAEGARRFPSGSLLKPAYDTLLSQMRSRIAAQVIADNRARGEIEPVLPPEPPLPPPEPKIYTKPPELPPELPPEPPVYWKPPEPDVPPIVVKPPPTLPGEAPVVYPVPVVPTDVVPADVVPAGFDFGALLRPPLIYVLGGLAAFMLLKK